MLILLEVQQNSRLLVNYGDRVSMELKILVVLCQVQEV
nr:MAG TPA: hypothetical protein [Bacteriophage sp.]